MSRPLISFYPLRPLDSAAVEIPLNNHAQSAHIQGALYDDKDNRTYHNDGLDHICPDNGLQPPSRCIKYTDEAYDWSDDVDIYSSNWKNKLTFTGWN